jgi:hypothetical protein
MPAPRIGSGLIESGRRIGGNPQRVSVNGGWYKKESGDLKSREYRDAEGNVHHHTRTYVEQHGKKK